MKHNDAFRMQKDEQQIEFELLFLERTLSDYNGKTAEKTQALAIKVCNHRNRLG